jgi:ATP-dependent RNA helicase DDX46/PRP5
MFSATFPPHVEGLARRVLTRPLEIVVGGKAKAAAEIEQLVEVSCLHQASTGQPDRSCVLLVQVRPEDEKFRRLLQLLGTWYEKGQILVFVDTQQRCDNLFMELVRAGYAGLTLHGGKDQYDRDQVCVLSLLVAFALQWWLGRSISLLLVLVLCTYVCADHS